jgi:hypothetical protein
MKEAGQEAEIPDVAAPFLLSYLLEIGPVINTGFGAREIIWQDIQAWQDCLGIRIPPWQARLVINLSKEYLSFSKKAEEPSCLSPLSDEARTEDRRQSISRSLRIGFKAMLISAGKQPRKKKKK